MKTIASTFVTLSILASIAACSSSVDDSAGSSAELNGAGARATCQWGTHCQEYVGDIQHVEKICTDDDGSKYTAGGQCPAGWKARCTGFEVFRTTINDYYYEAELDPFDKELCEKDKRAVYEQR